METAPVAAAGPHRGLIVIAHRGASGYRPEHTLEAYRLAIRQGADFIEPDLVATRDGVLIARHDNDLSATTDVAAHPEFAGRRTTKRVDGQPLTGWFTEDFTLDEIRTLRARERIPAVRPHNARFDGLYRIPTLAEILQLARRESRAGRIVGVYPETKHPTYFAREGRRLDGAPIATSLGARLVETLVAEGFTDPRRVFIQSFEVENLLELKQRIMPAAGVDFPLVQLYGALGSTTPCDMRHNAARGADLAAIYGGLGAQIAGGIGVDTRYEALATEPVLAWMRAHYASAIAPSKVDLPAHSARGENAGAATTDRAHPLLDRALAAGLLVHPYTLRAEEPQRTPAGVAQSVIDEAVWLYRLGVQGLFIDQPDLGVAARERFLDLQPRGNAERLL